MKEVSRLFRFSLLERPRTRASACLAILLGAACGAGAQDHSVYGGWTALTGQATGYFHVEKLENRWWLIDPAGNAFFSRGVNALRYVGDEAPTLGYAPYGQVATARYGSAEAWAESQAQRLWQWGFNTVGSWSDAVMYSQEMPYTVILNIGASAGANWLERAFLDVYDPLFASQAVAKAAEFCAPRRDDPWLLGYYSDNELAWEVGADALVRVTEAYLRLPANAPGKAALLGILQAKYPDIAALNAAWETAFVSYPWLQDNVDALNLSSAGYLADHQEFLVTVARRYFQVCTEAIRAADPHHLYLGCRFAWGNTAVDPVVNVAGEWVDVLTFNDYGTVSPTGTGLPFTSNYEAVSTRLNRPVMITEFSYRAVDSPQPNTKGAGVPPLQHQEMRGRKFIEYALAVAKSPALVGYHWFKHCDQPVEGRFDGENSNYGLVTLQDEPWWLLTTAATQVHRSIERIHRGEPATVLYQWYRTYDAAGKLVGGGSADTLSVTLVGGSAPWAATVSDAWIQLSGKTSGTATAANVKYTVAAWAGDATGQPRVGRLTVNGQDLVVVQEPPGYRSLFSSDSTYPLGGGWKWNALGFFYDGFFPFVWVNDGGLWIYVQWTNPAYQGGAWSAPDAEDSFYAYDFRRGQWGWFGRAFYPWYIPLGGSGTDAVHLLAP